MAPGVGQARRKEGPSARQGGTGRELAVLIPTNGDDAFIAEVNGAGEIAWVEFLATPEADFGNAVDASASGGAIMVGSYKAIAGQGIVYAVRFNDEGSREWTAELDWPGTNEGFGVAFTQSGEAYVVSSRQVDLYGFNRDAFVAKIDASGAIK
jgi:hypothetical protein